MAQKKAMKVKKEFESVLSCQKDKLCPGKGGAGSPAKEKDGGDAFFVFWSLGCLSAFLSAFA